MGDNLVEWVNLPLELWLVISKNMNTTIDVIRFRSICNLLRSILPLPLQSPSYRLRTLDDKFWQLVQTKIYRLEPLIPTCSSNSISNKGWIIKVEESKSGKLRHLDVLTNASITLTYPFNVLDFMNLRVRELFQAYNFYSSKYVCHWTTFQPGNDVNKVVLFPVEGRGQMAFVLNKDKKMRVCNVGYNNLIIVVGDGNRVYDDLILYMGKVYVVDTNGIIFRINCSSFALVQSSPPLNSGGKKKYLVESNGRLFVVDMYYERKRLNAYDSNIDTSVLIVDNDLSRWLHVSDLGDDQFVLGKDSNFSLSAKDYYGFERNCIYFHCRNKIVCISLNNSEIKYVDHISWLCPTLFNFNGCH